MNQIFKLIILIVVITSCVNLEEKPEGLLAPNVYYNSVSQIEAVLATSMNKVWSPWSVYGYGWGKFVNDDQLYGGNLIITSNWADDLWNCHYAALLNLNTALNRINAGSVQGASQEDIDLLIGQIKIVRAWNYFMLVRMFGDVPLYLEDDNPAISPKARTPIKEVYSQIVSDLTDAIAKLPATWPSEKKARPTSGTAKGLLAKVYVTMATAPLNETENYSKAADMAESVMNDGIYSLEHNVEDVFLEKNKYGPEILWTFCSTEDDQTTNPKIWGPTNKPYDGWMDFCADAHWDTLYPQQPRKDAYLIRYSDGVPYTQWLLGRRGPAIRKMLTMSLDNYNTWSSDANLPILRYADVLLLFAEAENMSKGGPTPKAIDAVNMIINRANGYVPNDNEPLLTRSMSKEAFDKAVIRERNLELCFEYDRWFDICRKRILPEVCYKQSQLDNYTINDYLFPIPAADLRLNKLLVQNPGYPKP